MTQHFRVAIGDAHDGARLDQALAALIPELSRRAARRVLTIGGVYIDGARCKVASRTVRAGQRIDAYVGRAVEEAHRPPPPLSDDAVAYEDDDVVVVDKPAGLFTAPTRESDRTDLVRLLADRGRPVRVVHRLDGEASGLVVFARSRSAAAFLSERLREHAMERDYFVIVGGAVAAATGALAADIDGRPARTRFARVETIDDRATLVRCRLETGRTHQIRRHWAGVGHPVAGDRRYGGLAADPGRLALHAHRLAFPHPRGGRVIVVKSPLPVALATWLDRLRTCAAEL